MPARPLRDRLADWRALAAVPPVADDPHAAAGRLGERLLLDLVGGHHRFREAVVFPNKRVPDGARRREIDLIVVTPHRLHLIEGKNWSGTLAADPGGWVQTARSGRVVRHPDLAADHRAKAAALYAYLRREGVDLPPDAWRRYACGKVVFVNPRLQILDPGIAEHPDVLTAGRLGGYLAAQPGGSMGERLAAAVIGWCLDTDAAGVVLDGLYGRLPPAVVGRVREAVGRLGTWDVLHWYGGRADAGDLLRLTVGGRATERRQLLPARGVRVSWTRGRWWGLAKAVSGCGWLGGVRAGLHPEAEARPGDSLLFHRAGEPQPIEVPLTAVDAVRLG